jgi:hypothetical protein
MINLTDFREEHPDKKQLGYFSDEQLQSWADHVPGEVIDFLHQEGECTYRNDFFRTILPKEYHAVFSDWGLEGNNCYAFLRSAFGALVYCFKGEYYVLLPYTGEGNFLSRDFDTVMNIHLSMHLVLEEAFLLNTYLEKKQVLPGLKADEIYAFVPAIPLGGSPETSKMEVVKMHEHLATLAELYEHKVTED